MDKQKKTTIHALSLPYPEPQWPSIPAEHEKAILQFLLPLLQPVRDFRRDHVTRSKGKGRAGKIKKHEDADSPPRWMPEVYDRLTIGFNSTVRRLESLARSRKPQILSESPGSGEQECSFANLAVVFVCRKNLPDIMTSSLPLLVATSAPKATRAKLVNISTQAQEKMAEALQQPRVGVLGVEEGTAVAETLLRFVQENISALDVPWLDQAPAPTYHPVKINTVAYVPKVKSPAHNRKRKRTANA